MSPDRTSAILEQRISLLKQELKELKESESMK